MFELNKSLGELALRLHVIHANPHYLTRIILA